MSEQMLVASWLNVTNLGQTVVNVLAVAGGFFLGAWLSGWLLQRLTRLLTPKKVYPAALWVIRLAGGVAAAWLVALFVFGTGGGWGFGGPGGGGLGEGPGSQPGTAEHNDTGTSKTVGPGPEEKLPPVAEKTLRVEVLGGGLSQQQRLNGQFYRLDREDKLQALPAVLEQIDRRKAGTPPLEKVEIVLYKDSPDRNTPAVEELRSAVSRRGLEAAITEVQAKAPSGKGASLSPLAPTAGARGRG
jgi:hypothetical protein